MMWSCQGKCLISMKNYIACTLSNKKSLQWISYAHNVSLYLKRADNVRTWHLHGKCLISQEAYHAMSYDNYNQSYLYHIHKCKEICYFWNRRPHLQMLVTLIADIVWHCSRYRNVRNYIASDIKHLPCKCHVLKLSTLFQKDTFCAYCTFVTGQFNNQRLFMIIFEFKVFSSSPHSKQFFVLFWRPCYEWTRMVILFVGHVLQTTQLEWPKLNNYDHYNMNP